MESIMINGWTPLFGKTVSRDTPNCESAPLSIELGHECTPTVTTHQRALDILHTLYMIIIIMYNVHNIERPYNFITNDCILNRK